MNGQVYLIHFDKPLHHARHYIGYSRDAVARHQRHVDGHGARLLQVLGEKGIGFEVVRVWEDQDRHFERKLKRRKNSATLCPICNKRIKSV